MTPTLTPIAVRPLAGLHDFVLPPELEATRPAEARGMTRDAVRMMVARRGSGHSVLNGLKSAPAQSAPAKPGK